jgi:N-acetylmuramic acid 6-phosphate etherase
VEPGPEVLAGSTRLKAGTAQKLVLNMLTTASMVKIGKTYQNLMVDLNASNDKLKRRAIRLVGHLARVPDNQAKTLLVETHWKVKPAVVMGMLGVSFSEAAARLESAGGILRAALKS